MAYDRYDSESERGWRSSGREERGHGGRDDYGGHHGSGGGRDEDRGWFERAGDEIASWFGGGDDEGRHHRGNRDERLGRDHRSEFDRDRQRSRDDDRFVYGDWGSLGRRGREHERERGSDHRYGSAHRDQDEDRHRSSARPMDWSSSQHDYRSSSQDRDGWFGGARGRDSDRERSYGSRYGSPDRDGFDRSDRDGSDRGSYRPITGDYGRSGGYNRSETPWGRDDYRSTSDAGSDRDRHRGMERSSPRDHEREREHDEYRRERQSRFEEDFGSWRNQRENKRGMLSQIREHMHVVGSDGERVGSVDRVAGDRIILTKADSPDGRHHSVPFTMVDRVSDGRVMLDCPSKDAQRQWRDDDRERALFEREDQGRSGPHALERSFSGTYRR